MKESTKNKRYLRHEALDAAMQYHHIDLGDIDKQPTVSELLNTASKMADFIIKGQLHADINET